MKFSTHSNLELFLESKGFNIDQLGGNCPFQIHANHYSGLSIYFRSRDTTASLEVYDEHYSYPSGLPDDESLLWEGEFENWDSYEAGWIDFDEAFYVFYQLWSDAKEVVEELDGYKSAIAPDDNTPTE